MSNRYTPPKRGFERATMQEANSGCGPYVPELAVAEKCPVCRRTVILHCGTCKVQTTGCLCTLKEKMSREELLTAQEIAMAERAGIWTPKSRN